MERHGILSEPRHNQHDSNTLKEKLRHLPLVSKIEGMTIFFLAKILAEARVSVFILLVLHYYCQTLWVDQRSLWDIRYGGLVSQLSIQNPWKSHGIILRIPEVVPF